MARHVSELSVFVASPSDLEEERDALNDVVRELNLQLVHSRGIRLELIRWETHAYPGVGADTQDVINRQVGDDYDIFLGLLGTRFGTPTPRAGSGTEEEFDRALARFRRDERSLRIMLYFKTGAVDLSRVEPTELARVRQFQSTLGPKGVLYWEFVGARDLASFARIHLLRCVDDWGKNWGHEAPSAQIGTHGEPPRVDEPDSEEEGFLDLVEMSTMSFEKLGEQGGRISACTEALSAKLGTRTREIKEATDGAGGKDIRALKRVCNAAAGDLEEYASIMDAEVPIFGALFERGIEGLVKAAVLLPDFSRGGAETISQLDDAIVRVSSLEHSMADSVGALSRFRQAIAAQPRATTQYNRARRHALRSLDLFLTNMKMGIDRLAECQKSLGAVRAGAPA